MNKSADPLLQVLKEEGREVFVYRTLHCSQSLETLAVGDRILAVNGQPVQDKEQVRRLFAKVQ